VLALQRRVGNRATTEFIAVQRNKGDAQKFAERHGLVLGDSVNRKTVERFVYDSREPKNKRLRAGLLQAWNRRYRRAQRIPVPDDLVGLMPRFEEDSSGDEARPSPAQKRRDVMDLSGYDSGNEKKMPHEDLERVRRNISDDEAEELGAKIYRDADRVTILLSTGYVANKYLGRSNFIKGPGSGSRSAYPKLIPRVSEAVGGDAKLASLLETGLMRMPEFEAAISAAPAAVKDQVQFVLVLMINEIVGRSTSNLVEIMATLQKTKANQDDDQLLRRMLERCLFAPKGGQKLSRVGHGDLQVEKLKSSLRKVLDRNAGLYYSLAKNRRRLGRRAAQQVQAPLRAI
jgi:hypothetical protein